MRWAPGTPERLQAAALDLFESRGFDETTAADIAAAVGVTERTFFRHFVDKREVLFGGREFFEGAFLRGVAEAPADATALEIMTLAIEGAAEFFPADRREHSRKRQRIIDRHPALRERELLKMAGLSTTLAAALRDRGIADPQATLAAQSGTTVFSVSFQTWVGEGETRGFLEIEEDVLRELTSMAASGPAAPAGGVHG